MNIEKKDEFKDMLSKVVGGVLIAAISGSIAWSLSIGSRVSVLEAKQLNLYQDIVQTQERIENHTNKINGMDKVIINIFNELKDIQKEQLVLSKIQTEQMKEIKDSMSILQKDVDYLKTHDEDGPLLKRK